MIIRYLDPWGKGTTYGLKGSLDSVMRGGLGDIASQYYKHRGWGQKKCS